MKAESEPCKKQIQMNRDFQYTELTSQPLSIKLPVI